MIATVFLIVLCVIAFYGMTEVYEFEKAVVSAIFHGIITFLLIRLFALGEFIESIKTSQAEFLKDLRHLFADERQLYEDSPAKFSTEKTPDKQEDFQLRENSDDEMEVKLRHAPSPVKDRTPSVKASTEDRTPSVKDRNENEDEDYETPRRKCTCGKWCHTPNKM